VRRGLDLEKELLITHSRMAFFFGCRRPHIFSGLCLESRFQALLDFRFAAPRTSPEQTPAPLPGVCLGACSHPGLSTSVPGVRNPGETGEWKFQPEEKGTKQAPGFQDAGQVLPRWQLPRTPSLIRLRLQPPRPQMRRLDQMILPASVRGERSGRQKKW